MPPAKRARLGSAEHVDAREAQRRRVAELLASSRVDYEGPAARAAEACARDVRAALINGTSSVVPLAVLSELSRTALPELLGNDDAIYADLMRREAALSREHGLPHGHVACAPLSRARAARDGCVL